jgi:hypothetical protein
MCSPDLIAGCSFSTQKYLKCKNDFMGRSISHYELPPALIHQARLGNPACAGFRISNDQASGDLMGISSGLGIGLFQV